MLIAHLVLEPTIQSNCMKVILYDNLPNSFGDDTRVFSYTFETVIQVRTLSKIQNETLVFDYVVKSKDPPTEVR